MATTIPSSSASARDNDSKRTSLPPRRGQIKALILKSTVRSASKVGKLLGIYRTNDAAINSSSRGSAPGSTY
ncbi:hypothetical protein SAY87_015595 [Trapa incisa]|uniref:Uncharacterized protein n=1 Tax=Trapa incisa TaxID=236973 RepID=A0AAN7L8E6_9MYRT|nr:hypothetical protein SAY87_015595 [Trapa incisa]